jgi:hypothetical protein
MKTRAWIVAACVLASLPAAAAQTLGVGPNVGSTGVTAESGSVAQPEDQEVYLDMGNALAGTYGEPILSVGGSLIADSSAEIKLENAKAYAPAVLVISDAFNPTAFKGGMLVPSPAVLQLILRTKADGSLLVVFDWDAQLPSGLDIYMQFVIQDPAAVQLFALSNAISIKTP